MSNKQFSWRFNPLSTDPNSVEITSNGVAFLKTSSLENAERVCAVLNNHQALVEALAAMLAEFQPANPQDEERYTPEGLKAIEAARLALAPFTTTEGGNDGK